MDKDLSRALSYTPIRAHPHSVHVAQYLHVDKCHGERTPGAGGEELKTGRHHR